MPTTADHPFRTAAIQSAKDDIASPSTRGDIQAFLNAFYGAAKQILREDYGIDADDVYMKRALEFEVDVEDELQIYQCHLTDQQMAAIVATVPRALVIPVESETLAIPEAAFPPDLPFLRTRQVVKHSGTVWEIHKYDADPFPHPVHAHSFRYKLDLRNGKIYVKRNLKSQMRRKDLIEFRAKVRRIELPPLEE